MLEVAENTVVEMELTESEQSFVDTACAEMGIASRTEFVRVALAGLQALKSQWPDSFRLLLSA